MTTNRGMGRAAALGLAFLLSAGMAEGRVLPVPAHDGALAAVLGGAVAGDTLHLAPGVHRGRTRMVVPVTLRGERGTVLEGEPQGSVVTIEASNVVLEDLEIRRSGARVITVDSGVRVIGASGVRLLRLRLDDVLYGISAERSDDLLVEGCRLTGRVPPRMETGEGNGLHLWYCRAARLLGNDVTGFVDGIYLSFADDAHVEGNHPHDLGRYGLHTMYCQRTRLIANTFTHNVAGIAIMFSGGLEVKGNWMLQNRGPRTYGLLLRDCSGGRFEDNQLVDNTVGIFMDNSNRNHLIGNRLESNGWGVILFSSCAANEFAANDFIENDYPVALDMRRTNNRFDDGRRGNYWSGSTPYDLDGDGVSDVPYSPVSAFAFVSKQYPDLSVLAKSPAVVALTVAERVFPAFQPSEAVDRFPSVRPVAERLEQRRETRAPRRSWPAFAFFGLMLGGGGVAMARARRAW